MNCIILLLLLFCSGNTCGNGCGSRNNSSCGNSNSCGARKRSEECECSADRDRRPPRPDFPNFTPVDDPAFSRRNEGRCETCGCEQNS